MRLCHRCRSRSSGAELRMGYQTEARWVCWSCLQKLAGNGGDWMYGRCCLERPPFPDSVACDCIYPRTESVCGGPREKVSTGFSCTETHSTTRNIGRSNSVSEGHGIARGMTLARSVAEQLSKTMQHLTSLKPGEMLGYGRGFTMIDPHGDLAREMLKKFFEPDEGFIDGEGI